MQRRYGPFLLAFLILSGCGGAKQSSGGVGTPTSLRRSVENAGSAALPAGMVDIIGPEGRRTANLLSYAQDVLVQRCMQAAGFQLAIEPYSEQAVDDKFRADLASHQVRTLDTAAQAGYGITSSGWPPSNTTAGPSSSGASDPSTAKNTATFDALPEAGKRAWRQALFGPLNEAGQPIDSVTFEVPGVDSISTSAQGCYADARKQLYGDLNSWLRGQATSTGIAPEISTKVESDPRVLTVFDAWRACMATAGIPVQDRSLAFYRAKAQVAASPSRDAAFELERHLAVQDVQCAIDSKYDETYQHVWEEMSAQVLSDHTGDIEAYKESLASAEQQANSVLNR